MDNQTMMRERQEQEQQSKTLDMYNEEETALGDQTARTESRLELKIDEVKNWQRSVKMTRQLGLYGMETVESFHAEEYNNKELEQQAKSAKLTRLNEKAERLEEKKKKKYKQEKAAKKRLGSKTHNYFEVHKEHDLKDKAKTVETQKRDGKIFAGYALCGDEFALNEDGKLEYSPEALLKKQAKMELYIEQQERLYRKRTPGEEGNAGFI